MKNKRIVRAMSDIDDSLICEAEADVKKAVKVSPVYKWGAVAACFAVVLAVAICLPMMLKDDAIGSGDATVDNPIMDGEANGGSSSGIFLLDELNGRYKDENIVSSESGYIEWPWNELSDSERYAHISFNGKEYTTRARKVSSELLKGYLGDCEAYGYEYTADKSIKHTKTFEFYEIKNVDQNVAVAVNFDGEYYVYSTRDIEKPATLGDLMDVLGLDKTVKLEKYTLYEGKDKKGYYRIESDDYIMNVLLECKDAPAMQDDMTLEIIGDEYAAFTVTSEALGIYKKTLYISSLGYVFTNAMEYGYTYNIGADAAKMLLDYLKGENAIETTLEPYRYSLCGVVKEIGDGYIMLDDSIMCEKASDGMILKIDMSNAECYRYINHKYIKAGDVAVISFEEKIQVDTNNTIVGAVSISKAQLVVGDVIIKE